MAEPADGESARPAEKRVQPFLDCISYLLAKRWLRDQRQQEEKTPRDGQEPRAKETESQEPLDHAPAPSHDHHS